MIRAWVATFVMWLSFAGGLYAQETTRTILQFADLDGWNLDNHADALDVFLSTCPDMRDPDWSSLCALGQQKPDAKAFFELFFRPVLIEDGERSLFTGYFEPELNGSLTPSSRYRYPIYREPVEAKTSTPWLTRREILEGDFMRGKGYEIAWVDDPVEKFFLQIQGSGRIRLPDGTMIRVGYGGSNGHTYRSIGAEMVRRGIYKPHQVSAQVIKNWVRRNPQEGQELLFFNPAYVFFRRIDDVPPGAGPLGAMNRSVTALRSIAVDPAFYTLGAPVWIEKGGQGPMRRLMVAQDTGSAIKGAQRADIFFGTGNQAGFAAGQLKDPGRMVVLLPIQRAYATLTEGIE